MMKDERFIYYVNAIYFVYTIHYLNIVIYNIINLLNLLFTLIYFQSLINDNLLKNLLLECAVKIDLL